MRPGSKSSCESWTGSSPWLRRGRLRRVSCAALALWSCVGCDNPSAPQSPVAQAGSGNAIAGRAGNETASAGNAGVAVSAAGHAGNAAAGDAAAGNAAAGKPVTGSAGAGGANASGGDPLVFGSSSGDSTRPAFCERADADADVVRELFCASERPEIRSLQELQAALSLVPSASSDTATNYPYCSGIPPRCLGTSCRRSTRARLCSATTSPWRFSAAFSTSS